jgi:hypothetical protein
MAIIWEEQAGILSISLRLSRDRQILDFRQKLTHKPRNSTSFLRKDIWSRKRKDRDKVIGRLLMH